MPWAWPKIFKCFPSKKPKKREQTDNGNGSDIVFLDNDGFTKKQKAKAVAIVLSGYDAEIAAASIGPPCDSETVQKWVSFYRPPFFEEGMRCPPALIIWWMKETERKNAEFSDALEEPEENEEENENSLTSISIEKSVVFASPPVQSPNISTKKAE